MCVLSLLGRLITLRFSANYLCKTSDRVLEHSKKQCDTLSQKTDLYLVKVTLFCEFRFKLFVCCFSGSCSAAGGRLEGSVPHGLLFQSEFGTVDTQPPWQPACAARSSTDPGEHDCQIRVTDRGRGMRERGESGCFLVCLMLLSICHHTDTQWHSDSRTISP